jgi:hypothetical protein
MASLAVMRTACGIISNHKIYRARNDRAAARILLNSEFGR